MRHIKTILRVTAGGVLLLAVLALTGCGERGYITYGGYDDSYYYPGYSDNFVVFGGDFGHRHHHHDWAEGRHAGWSGGASAFSAHSGARPGGVSGFTARGGASPRSGGTFSRGGGFSAPSRGMSGGFSGGGGGHHR